MHQNWVEFFYLHYLIKVYESYDSNRLMHDMYDLWSTKNRTSVVLLLQLSGTFVDSAEYWKDPGTACTATSMYTKITDNIAPAELELLGST